MQRRTHDDQTPGEKHAERSFLRGTSSRKSLSGKTWLRATPRLPHSSICTAPRIRLWFLCGLLLGVTSVPVLSAKTTLAQNPSAPAGSITNMAPNPGTQANPNHPAPAQRNTLDQGTLDNRNAQSLQNQQQESARKSKQTTTEWPNVLPTNRPPTPSNPSPLVPRVIPPQGNTAPGQNSAPGLTPPAGL